MSTASFNADLQGFSERVGIELDVVVRKVALEIYDKITRKTPVDTGRARASWNVSAGSIDSSVASDSKKGTGAHRGSSEPPASPAAKRVTLKKNDGKKSIYITNSLPYIGKLENGDSSQAAAGAMIAVSLSEVEAGISDVISG